MAPVLGLKFALSSMDGFMLLIYTVCILRVPRLNWNNNDFPSGMRDNIVYSNDSEFLFAHVTFVTILCKIKLVLFLIRMYTSY